MNCIPYRYVWLIIGAMLGASCSGFSGNDSTPTLTQTPTVHLVTATEPVTPSPIRTPTTTATQLPAATRTATATIAPTLAPEQAQAVVSELLRTNGECELPCWWGIVPGETTWDEARSVVQPLASRLVEYGQLISDTAAAEVVFLERPAENAAPYLHLRFGLEMGTVERILASDFEAPNYRIRPLLTTYGIPDEVWIQTEGFTPEPYDRGMVLALYYAQRGIIATYSTTTELADDLIRGCFDGFAGLRLWGGKSSLDFTEVAERFDWDVQSVLYLPLSEATDLSVQTFFENAISRDEVCLQTPNYLWP